MSKPIPDYRQIMSDDVGKPTLDAFGRKWPVEDFIGQIFPQDVGKLVYLVGDILQVENDEQRNNRRTRFPQTVWFKEFQNIRIQKQ